MVIGRHEPQRAKDTDLKTAIAIGLDEAATALEECFHDLADEQVWRYVLPGRHNIATLVSHCLFNLDLHCCQCQTGANALEHLKQFDIWHHPPEVVRAELKSFPSVKEMLGRLATLRAAIVKTLEAAGEQDLRGPCSAAPEWYRQNNRSRADTYMRTICHTMTHIRQIWLMRGALGLTDRHGWPEQHWA